MARAPEPDLSPAHARSVARDIVARLRDAGHAAYFAGGCVRDELLGLHPTDYDVATDAPPTRIRALFSRTSEVGAAFGVMLVFEGGVTVEVATFRSDGTYTDARRPDVVHFSDAPSDAARRDFTINALFLDPLAPPDPVTRSAAPAMRVDGRVIDYVGGLDDLHARVVRAVGDAEQRLAEDHLRALRAVRFAARLGFDIHADTARAIKRHAQALRGVSRERIGEELRRMLTHTRRAHAVRWLEELGLDSPVLNAGAAEDLRLSALRAQVSNTGSTEPTSAPWQRGVLAHFTPGTPSRSLQRSPSIGVAGHLSGAVFAAALAAWGIDRAGGLPGSLARGAAESASFARELVRQYRPALCLSNSESEQLSDVVGIFEFVVHVWDESRVCVQKRAAARELFPIALDLLHAADPARSERIQSRYKELETDGVGLNPAPLVTGDDLVAAGLKPGPSFKRVLDEVYDRQLEGGIRSSGEAMELARSLYV